MDDNPCDKEWLYDSLFGPEYRRANPEIDEFNTFSCSTLAYDIDKQVIWKTQVMEAEFAEVNFFMLVGRAVHEYLQHRLPKTYATEQKLILEIPHKWVYAPFKSIKILGHIDAVDYMDKRMLEFKTTWSAKDATATYMRQEGFYAQWMKMNFGKDFLPRIYRIRMKFSPPKFAYKGEAIDWLSDYIDMEPGQVETAYLDIVDRAQTAAAILDEWWGNNREQVKELPNGGISLR